MIGAVEWSRTTDLLITNQLLNSVVTPPARSLSKALSVSETRPGSDSHHFDRSTLPIRKRTGAFFAADPALPSQPCASCVAGTDAFRALSRRIRDDGERGVTTICGFIVRIACPLHMMLTARR
jgi:hypothetical protein